MNKNEKDKQENGKILVANDDFDQKSYLKFKRAYLCAMTLVERGIILLAFPS